MAHLTCAAHSRAELEDILTRYAARRRAERARARRRPAQGPEPPARRPRARDRPRRARARDRTTSRSASRCTPRAIPPRPNAPRTGAGRPRSSRRPTSGCRSSSSNRRCGSTSSTTSTALGVTTPVTPGIMPVTNVKSVKRMAELSGADFPSGSRTGCARSRTTTTRCTAVGVEAATELCRGAHGRRRRALPLLHAQPLHRDPRDLRQPRPRRRASPGVGQSPPRCARILNFLMSAELFWVRRRLHGERRRLRRNEQVRRVLGVVGMVVAAVGVAVTTTPAWAHSEFDPGGTRRADRQPRSSFTSRTRSPTRGQPWCSSSFPRARRSSWPSCPRSPAGRPRSRAGPSVRP